MSSDYDVKTYGATGDGHALDQEAIQRAIDDCHRKGGGRVYLAPGRYLSGTLRLRSNVCLYLEMGARIVAADDSALFPVICKTPFGNLPGHIQALLFADEAENVAVCGPGAVDGNSESPLPPEVAAEVFFRPALVFFRNCQGVRFQDVTLAHSAFWTLHLLRCREVMIRGCTIKAHPDRINADGIDPDGCEDVTISDCQIDTGDDCIVIKSTEGDVCRNIVITNCILRSTQAALKIGTEAMGDIRNITFTNCVVRESKVALALFMKDGSTYENIVFSNMIVEATHDFPVLVDHTPRYHKEPRFGHIRHVLFENVFVRSPGRCLLEGVESHPLENVVLRNVTWTVTAPSHFETAAKPPGARRIDPDPNAVSYARKKAQIIAAHVKGLTLDQFKIIHEHDGMIPEPLYLHEVEFTSRPTVTAPPTRGL